MSQCTITCRTCGNAYILSEGELLRECAACGTVNERPQAEGEALDRLQRATRLRLKGEFSEALKCYDFVLMEYDNEHEALWGKLLCQYGVEFVADPRTGVRRATVHIPRSRPMQLHADFARACELAPEAICAQYEAEAAYVDEALAEIRRRTENEPPYDVFICHKTTPLTGGGYTEDYNRGVQLTRRIEKAGYSVFFAPFADLLSGANYEAGIYHALSTAKVMLLIASDAAFLTSPWVKSEWSRYLEMLDDGADKHLIPLMYGGLSNARMPREIRVRSLQSIRMEDFDAAEKVMAALARYTGKEAVPAPQPAPEAVKTRPEDVPAPAQQPAPAPQSAPEAVKTRPEDVSAPAQQPAPAPQPAPEAVKTRPEDVPAPAQQPVPAPQPAPEAVKTRQENVPAPAPHPADGPAPAYAPESEFTTEVVDGGVAIVKYTGSDGEVLIPPTIGGRSVLAIGERAFEGQKTLTKVVIPEGVTCIGDGAFYACGSLISVSIPEGVMSIGESAFFGCSGLTSVGIPGSVTSIGDWAFYSCRSLTSVSIPEGVTSIGDWTFYSCHRLTNVSIPESVTHIGDCAFYCCRSLTGVSIPEGVSGIGQSAFDSCSSLTNVSIPEGVEHIGESAFASCPKLTLRVHPNTSALTYAQQNRLRFEVIAAAPKTAPQPAGDGLVPSRPAAKPTLAYAPASDFTTEAVEGGVAIVDYTGPGGEVLIPPTIGGLTVMAIGENAFEEKSLKKVVIPEGVVSIGSSAFSGCADLQAVELPGSLRSIGWGAFKRCVSLAGVPLPEGVSEIAAAAFSHCTSLKTVCIPASVTGMEWNPFDCCSSLQTIDVAQGNPMYYIHNHALISRSGVLIGYPIGREPEQFIVPPGVTMIGGWSFQRSRITGVTIPEGVQCIGAAAFDNSLRLERVHIPGSVLEIHTNPFNGCNAMKEITVAPGSMMYCANENVLFSRVGVLVCYPSGLKDERYDVPAGTKSIGAWAMRSNTALKNIGIPESVTELGTNALPYTTTFTLRVHENSPAHVYAQQNNLRVELIPAAVARPRPASAPRSAASVPDYEREWSFQTENVDGGVSITKYTGKNVRVRIPPTIDGKKVVEIGERAFYENRLVEVFIPDGVKSIGDYAFSGSPLANITIPDSVTLIGVNPFKGCHGLTDITVSPDHPTLEVVEGVLFDKKAKKLIYYPYELKNSCYTVPHGIRIIGASAFFRCSYSLTEIHLPASVTTIGEYAFSYCDYLRDINLPEGVTSIGDYAFFWCKSMTTLTIPSSVVSIGESVFKGCEALTLRVCADSYAHKYARARGLKFELITTDHVRSTTTEKSAPSLFSRLFGKK